MTQPDNSDVSTPNAERIETSEFRGRCARARELAAERGLGGLLVWSRGGTSFERFGDVCYLANFHSPLNSLPDTRSWTAHGHAAVVLPVDDEPVLLADAIDDPDGRIAMEDARAVPHLPQAVAAVMKEKGLAGKRVGLVGGQALGLPWLRILEREMGSSLQLESTDDVLDQLRYVKSAQEVELIRHAAAVGVGWMNTSMGAVEPGRTEAEIVGEGLKYLASHGGQPYDVGISSGPTANHYYGTLAIPHWNCERRLEKGDLLHCDQWGPVQGYFTDIARSTVVGVSPTVSQRELLEGAKNLVEHIVAGIQPGVTWGELYRRAADWLEGSEFPAPGADSAEAGHSAAEVFPAFGHSLGLGEELPYVISDESAVLVPNVVLAIEGAVGRPNLGMAEFEHNVLVTGQGHEVLDESCPAVWW